MFILCVASIFLRNCPSSTPMRRVVVNVPSVKSVVMGVLDGQLRRNIDTTHRLNTHASRSPNNHERVQYMEQAIHYRRPHQIRL